MTAAIGDHKQKAREAARKARAMAAKLENAAGIVSDAERMRAKRRIGLIVRVPTLSPANRAERERREADDILWVRSYWSAFSPDAFYEPSEQQRQMAADFSAALQQGGDRAVAASRGEGKTTWATALTVKSIMQGVVDFAVILAANARNAADILETIDLALSDDPELARYYPEVCVPVGALEHTAQRAGKQLVSGNRHDTGEPYEAAPSAFHWASNELVFPHVPGSPSSGAIVVAQGLDSALRSLKKRNRRPRIVLIDNPDTDDTIHNPAQADKLLKKIDRGIAALGSQKRPVTRIALVTIASHVSVAAKLTDTTVYPSWRGRRFKFLLTPPTATDLWQQFVALCHAGWATGTEGEAAPPIPIAAHRLYLERRDAMDAGAVVSNPNRFDTRLRPEGGTVEVSAIEHYYGWVARIGPENTATEFDNQPPEPWHHRRRRPDAASHSAPGKRIRSGRDSSGCHPADDGGRRRQVPPSLGCYCVAAGRNVMANRLRHPRRARYNPRDRRGHGAGDHLGYPLAGGVQARQPIHAARRRDSSDRDDAGRRGLGRDHRGGAGGVPGHRPDG